MSRARSLMLLALVVVTVAAVTLVALLSSAHDGAWRVIEGEGLADAEGMPAALSLVNERSAIIAITGAERSSLYRTADGGRSWERVVTSNGTIGGVTCVSGQCWATTGRSLPGMSAQWSALLRSTDAGETWRQIYESVPGQRISWVSFDALDSGVALVAEAKGMAVMATIDGGETWSRIGSVAHRGEPVAGGRTIALIGDTMSVGASARLVRIDRATGAYDVVTLPEDFEPARGVIAVDDDARIIVGGTSRDRLALAIVTGARVAVVHLPGTREQSQTASSLLVRGDTIALFTSTLTSGPGLITRFHRSTNAGRTWRREEAPEEVRAEQRTTASKGDRLWVMGAGWSVVTREW